MPGRLDQAHARAAKVAKRRMDRLAELVANGMGVNEAGNRLSLTKGQAAHVWRSIKAGLGEQAR